MFREVLKPGNKGTTRLPPTCADQEVWRRSEIRDAPRYARRQLGSWLEWAGWKSLAGAGQRPMRPRLFPGVRFEVPCSQLHGGWVDPI